jgi:hypothetical protein
MAAANADGSVTYACDCGGVAAHTHRVSAAEARRRGQHPAPASAPSGAAAPAAAVYARDLRDALRGALLAMMCGDALAAPLHWFYSWDALRAAKARAFAGSGGRLAGYCAGDTAAPGGAHPHPDSWKYFARCDATAQPVRALFGGAGSATERSWAVPGTAYHATLRAGDNSLTARLVAAVVEHVAQDGGFDAQAFFAERYVPLLTRQQHAQAADSAAGAAAAAAGGDAAAAPPQHGDTWVDETHRVLFRNLAAGAAPWEAGMDDVCLTSLALAAPLLLAYAGDRDARERAVRCLLQLTHKSEDAVRQALDFGDLLALLLAPHVRGAGAGSGAGVGAGAGAGACAGAGADVQAALHASFATFAEGRMDLTEVLSRGLSDEDAYHGPRTVFSSR